MSDPRIPRQGSSARRHALPAARAVASALRLETAAARALPLLRLADPSQDAYRRGRERLERELAAIRATDAPVIVGPWLSEVGIELLYWVPFLRRLGLDPARVVGVSRGGVESWYDGLFGDYVDVFELMTEDELREALAASWDEQGGQKQFHVSSLDRTVIDAVSARQGLAGAHVLHPSVMLGLFSEYWLGRIPLAQVLPYLQFGALTPPAVELDLPERYVTARFYFRESFPDTPANRRLVARSLERLAGGDPVVLLDTGVNIDDHSQVPLPEGTRVLTPLAGASAVENLRLQSAVLAGARAFVGTYGGLCYLANGYGVPAFALLTPPAPRLGLTHTAIARRISEATGGHLSIVATTALETLS